MNTGKAQASFSPRLLLVFIKSRQSVEGNLLSNAEGAEDQIEDVVGGGGAGDGIERPQGVVEIEQQHLVRDLGRDGDSRGIEGC